MMEARYTDVVATLSAIDPDQPGRVLDLLGRVLGLTDAAIAKRSKMSRATINAKRNGTSPVRLQDLGPLAAALEVPVEVLISSPRDALRWIASSERLEDPQDGPRGVVIPMVVNDSPIGDFACNLLCPPAAA